MDKFIHFVNAFGITYSFLAFLFSYSDSKRMFIEIPFPGVQDIRCENRSLIRITNITVAEETNLENCTLNVNDIHKTKQSCDGKEHCTITGSDWTSECLWEDGHFNFSYVCTASNHSCDFEHGLCTWSQDDDDDFNWTVRDVYHYPPYRDHTTATRAGHIISTGYNSAGQLTPSTGSKARLSSDIVISNDVKCLVFWYQMYGTTLGTLNVYQFVGSDLGLPLRTIQKNTQDSWNKMTVNLTNYSSYRVAFESIQGGSYSSISVDDIQITDGPCSSLVSKFDCTFEETVPYLCGWNINNTNSRAKWTRFSNNGRTWKYPYYDHTFGSRNGHYMRLRTVDIQSTMSSRLIYVDSLMDVNMCLKFSYFIYSSSLNDVILNIILQYGTEYDVLWTTTEVTYGKWLQATVDITVENLNTTHIFYIQGTIGPTSGFEYLMAIDDITMTTGFCSGDKEYNQQYDSIIEPIDIQQCPKMYLETQNSTLDFFPNFTECLIVYDDMRNAVRRMCDKFDDSEYCSLPLQDVKDYRKKCFSLPKNIEIVYTCAEAYSQQSSERVEHNNASVISGVVGGSVAFGVVCFVVIVMCLFRRRRYPKSKSNGDNTTPHDTPAADLTLQQGNNTYYEPTQYYNVEDTETVHFSNTPDNTEDHTYQNNAYVENNEDKNSDISQLYSNVVKKKQSDNTNHIQQDPQTFDMYAHYEDGVYDKANKVQYKTKSRDNQDIYSHSLDDVYDSANQCGYSHSEDEDSYDHFIENGTENNFTVRY